MPAIGVEVACNSSRTCRSARLPSSSSKLQFGAAMAATQDEPIARAEKIRPKIGRERSKVLKHDRNMRRIRGSA
jgi:hypothetical protein